MLYSGCEIGCVRCILHCRKGWPEAVDGRLMILVTGYRRESLGEGAENICGAIREVAGAFPDAVFVCPVHLNPNVREPVNRIPGRREQIHLGEPLACVRFVWLMDQAAVLVSHSGGVREDAPSAGKPVLVMRETTERPEGIEAGNATLVGVQKEQIVGELLQLLHQP